jgi:hypothetical protein
MMGRMVLSSSLEEEGEAMGKKRRRFYISTNDW